MNKVKKRETIYDFIRVFSCICVIGIHSTNHLLLESIARIGLPMFVFLSGVLILNGNEEKVSDFYFKRIIKIVIPLYLYSLFYLFVYKYNYSLNIFSINNFILELKNITKGYVHYHLWYVYMILGIYLCAPYLKTMCKNLTTKECQNLTILIFIITLIKNSLPLLNINIGIKDIPFVNWTLIFLLGYLTNKEYVVKRYKFIYFLGIISFNFSIIARAYLPNLTNINDISVTMMLQLMAIYVFFVRNKKRICNKQTINKIISHISKYTWEMYLIHVFILDQIKTYIYNLNINSTISDIILILTVFLISYLLALIIHNLITKNIQRLIIKIKEFCSQKMHKIKI